MNDHIRPVNHYRLIDHPLNHYIYMKSPKIIRRLLSWVKYRFAVPIFEMFRKRHMIRTIKRSGLFYKSYYMKQYPQAVSDYRDPIKHYVETGSDNGFNPNPLFDTNYYSTTYPDVIENRQNPLYHYIRFGFREGRNPSANFSADSYLSYYSDVKESGINPLLHYLHHGVLEDRCLY